MSTVGTITKLATEVVGKAAHAVTHPRKTVSAVTGHARDLTASVTRADHKEVVPLEQSPIDGPDAPMPPRPSVVQPGPTRRAGGAGAARRVRGAVDHRAEGGVRGTPPTTVAAASRRTTGTTSSRTDPTSGSTPRPGSRTRGRVTTSR